MAVIWVSLQLSFTRPMMPRVMLLYIGPWLRDILSDGSERWSRIPPYVKMHSFRNYLSAVRIAIYFFGHGRHRDK